MTTSPTAQRRHELIRSLQLHLQEHDPAIDRVARIAATALSAPTALVTLIDIDRQRVRAAVGWPQADMPLIESFCKEAMDRSDILEVADAASDPRFNANPLVTGSHAIRFYAGYPIRFDGVALGAVCILDRVQRKLGEREQAILRDLADTASMVIEQRHVGRQLQITTAALRESEQLFREIVELADEAICLLSNDLELIFLNPKTASLLGGDIQALIGKRLSDLIEPESREVFRTAIACASSGGDASHDCAVRRSDGGVIWMSMNATPRYQGGHPIGFLLLMTDVSQRKKSESELRLSESRFRAISALSADWYWEQDAELRFTEVAGGTTSEEEALTRQYVVGRRIWEVCDPSMDAAVWRVHMDTLRRREPFRDLEVMYRGQEGELRVYAVSGEPIFDGDAFKGYRGVSRDVTEQRKVVAQRQHLEHALRESQRLEALGTLAGGIAHDFNNVIASILGNADLARTSIKSDTDALQPLLFIDRAARRARDLVQQILTFARRQPRRIEAVDLKQVVDEASGLLRATLPANVDLRMQLSDDRAVVKADATQINQVIINLATNAWQALEGRAGTVTIGVDRSADPERAETDSATAHLWVRDDGPGIPLAIRPHLFEPFFTTRPQQSGTGLGLAVAHGIVRTHGGTIRVETAEGAGSTFHVYLFADDSLPELTPRECIEAAARPNHERVLYVDDDEVMATMVKALLDREGYRVDSFVDPKEALAAFERRPFEYDVVVTDFSMPGMSGLDVADRLVHLRPDLPIILSSGNLPEQIDVAEHRAMFRAFLHKPDTLDRLPALIQEVLRVGAISAAGKAAE